MQSSKEIFINESKRFSERLDIVQASVDAPDEQLVHQVFNTPKREVEKIDALVKKGELDLEVAKDRRSMIMIPAWRLVCMRVLNSWNTRDMLDELFERYHQTVMGSELQHLNGKKDARRKETLRVFDEVRREFAAF